MPPSNSRRSGNPAKRAAAAGTPASSPVRETLSERSRGILVKMSQLPPLVIPGLMLVFMLVGLAAPLWAAIPALAVVTAFVAWLAFISWPVLDTRGKFTRGLMLGLVLGAGIARIYGWL